VAGSFAGQSLVGRVGVWWVAAGGAALLGAGALLLSAAAFAVLALVASVGLLRPAAVGVR
jgi:hypothetical protein